MSTAVVSYAEQRAEHISHVDGVEYIGGIPVNDIAARFPLLPDDEFDELCQSIDERGMDEFIHTKDGELVDGRNRMLACLVLGLIPELADLPDDVNVDDYIRDKNIYRRSLTKSQRAMLLALCLGEEVEDRVGSVCQAAGVSQRMGEQAVTVADHGVAALHTAVVDGQVNLGDAAVVSQGTDENQRGALDQFSDSEQTAADREQLRDTATATSPAKKQEKKAAAFRFGKWEDSMQNTLSRLLSRVPEDQRERCTHAIGASLSVSVRRSTGEEAFEDFEEKSPETIVGLVEDIISCIPAKDQRKARERLSAHYQEDPDEKRPKTASEVMPKIAELLGRMKATERKKLESTLRGSLGAGDKPTDYLPMLPAEHKAALGTVVKELEVRARQLKSFEGWDVNGRRKEGHKALGKMRKAISGFSRKAGIDRDNPDDPDVIWPQAFVAREEFRTLWEHWLDWRESKGRTTAKPTQTQQLKKLSHFRVDVAIRILQQGIENDWQGIPASIVKGGFLLDGENHVGQKPTVIAKESADIDLTGILEGKAVEFRMNDLQVSGYNDPERDLQLHPCLQRRVKQAEVSAWVNAMMCIRGLLPMNVGDRERHWMDDQPVFGYQDGFRYGIDLYLPDDEKEQFVMIRNGAHDKAAVAAHIAEHVNPDLTAPLQTEPADLSVDPNAERFVEAMRNLPDWETGDITGDRILQAMGGKMI